MMRNRWVRMAMVAAMSTSLLMAGCETQAGSAGAGAGLGALAGGIIGAQSGRAWEGAAIGAIVGGLAGLIVHDVRERQTRTAQQTYQQYDYQPSQGFQMNIEQSKISPATVAPGGQVTSSVEYATLGTGGGVPVKEKQVLVRNNEQLAEIYNDTVTRTDGTWSKSVAFELPKNAADGTYEVTQSLVANNKSIEKTSLFTVDSAAAKADTERYAAAQ